MNWIVDSHCHLDYDGLGDHLPDIMARAEAAGVGFILSISSRIGNHERIIEIAERFPNVYCTIGTHPHNAHEELDVPVSEIVRLTHHPKVVGIGEAGLDYHYDNSPREAQEKGFRNHIAAARETGLPLVIHTREAEDDTAKILEEEMAKGKFKALLHCFTSKQWLAERAVELGLCVSFSGILTYKNADDLRATARALPADRLFVETDAPFLSPIPFRGKPNEPSYVVKTLEHLASIRNVSRDEMARQTSDNFFRYFDKIPLQERFTIAA